MFDWFSPTATPILAVSQPDAIDLLKNDHDSIKDLFDRFKKAVDRRAKAKIATQALNALKIHTALEEEIFYPAVRQRVGKQIMVEADEEHHIANVLIAELEAMDGRGDHFDAKFNVLAENVLHHIKEEEREMLPKAQELDLNFVKLGQRMLARKEELLVAGLPVVVKKPARTAKSIK
ncbi:MAG TPA: hemerythrin domain-containing protein [Bryobacteraceae bacterium]|nr:hemerythrin domain-containing protein [Bryobacteraceae bacterium]